MRILKIWDEWEMLSLKERIPSIGSAARRSIDFCKTFFFLL